MNSLRPRQREELHAAIFAYLSSSNFHNAATAFQEEAHLERGHTSAFDDLLVKKWTSSSRMMVKISSLEKKLEDMTEKLQLYEQVSKFRSVPDGLPIGPPVRTLKGHRQAITSLKFHPVFLLLVSASADSTIKIWEYEEDPPRLERTLSEHTDAVNDIDFDETGKWMASCSSDTSVKIWDFAQMICAKTLYGHDSAVSSVAFMSRPIANRILSASRDRLVKLWDITTGFCLRTFSGHQDAVKGVASCPQFPTLFASCGSDFMIALWRADLPDRQEEAGFVPSPLELLHGHSHVVESCLFASSTALHHLEQHGRAPPPPPPSYRDDVSRLRTLGTSNDFHAEEATPTIQTSCGPILFSASRDNTIKMWDPLAAKCLFTFEGHNTWVQQLVCHPNGKYLISCSDDRSLRVWNILDGSCITSVLNAHTGFIKGLAIHPGLCRVATGSVDSLVHVWECQQRKPSSSPLQQNVMSRRSSMSSSIVARRDDNNNVDVSEYNI